MPNHCYNAFTIKGTKEQVATFIENCTSVNEQDPKQHVIDFYKIVPMPESLNIDSMSTAKNLCELMRIAPETPVTYQFAESALFPYHRHQLKMSDKLQRPWNEFTVGDVINLLRTDDEFHRTKDFELAEKYLQNYKDWGYYTWYEWTRLNWGTKWNAYDQTSELSEDGTVFTGIFYTAWGPAEPVYRKMAKEYPWLDISINYQEPGMFFAGTYVSDDEGYLTDIPYTEAELDKWKQELGLDDEEEEESEEQAELPKEEVPALEENTKIDI